MPIWRITKFPKSWKMHFGCFLKPFLSNWERMWSHALGCPSSSTLIYGRTRFHARPIFHSWQFLLQALATRLQEDPFTLPNVGRNVEISSFRCLVIPNPAKVSEDIFVCSVGWPWKRLDHSHFHPDLFWTILSYKVVFRGFFSVFF